MTLSLKKQKPFSSFFFGFIHVIGFFNKCLIHRCREPEGQVFDSCPKALEKYLNRFSLYVVSYRFPIKLVIGGKDIQKASLCQIFSEENESAAAKRVPVGSTEPVKFKIILCPLPSKF